MLNLPNVVPGDFSDNEREHIARVEYSNLTRNWHGSEASQPYEGTSTKTQSASLEK